MDKEQKAIDRLRLAAQMSETYYQKPLIVTTSGGKDSDVCIAGGSGINDCWIDAAGYAACGGEIAGRNA